MWSPPSLGAGHHCWWGAAAQTDQRASQTARYAAAQARARRRKRATSAAADAAAASATSTSKEATKHPAGAPGAWIREALDGLLQRRGRHQCLSVGRAEAAKGQALASAGLATPRPRDHHAATSSPREHHAALRPARPRRELVCTFALLNQLRQRLLHLLTHLERHRGASEDGDVDLGAVAGRVIGRHGRARQQRELGGNLRCPLRCRSGGSTVLCATLCRCWHAGCCGDAGPRCADCVLQVMIFSA